MIYVHLWDVISTNNDLAVGDTIMFTNDYRVAFCPHEVLGVCKPDRFLCPHRYPKNEDSALSF